VVTAGNVVRLPPRANPSPSGAPLAPTAPRLAGAGLARAHAIGDGVRDAILALEERAEVLVHIDIERDEPA
jgi:hypothetical protein